MNRARSASFFFLLALVLAATACRPRGKRPEPVDALSRQELLGAFGACALDSARGFQQQLQVLAPAVAQLHSQPDSASAEAARAAFLDALDAWQVAEVMRFGPAASRTTPGGEDLRDHIYSFPLISRCAVEEQLVSKAYESPDFGNSLINRRGLAALEYLLFYAGEDTACPASSSIVSSGSWAALGGPERAARKRAYAVAVTNDLSARAAALVNAWDESGGNFLATFSSAGPENTVYPSTQLALNQVSDALFYIEREVKDLKLARPLGLRDCASATCPEWVESPFSGRSKANLLANLEGFRRIMQGCQAGHEGLGFDDLLVHIGAEETWNAMRGAADQTGQAVEALEEPELQTALAQDLTSVRAVYDALKGITDLLKTDFTTVLDLELPESLEGDND